MEIWKDIKGYKKVYQVSNLGRVKRLATIQKVFNRYQLANRRLPERILKGGFDKDGYNLVMLTKKGKSKTFKIHRLTALAFIPNPNKLPVINHKNGIKNDNRLENLEWCSYAYNEEHKNRVIYKKKRGVHWHKLNNKYIAHISFKKKTIHLGYFKTKEEGYEAYRNKYLELYGKEPW